MKQTFTLELECLDTIRHSMEDEFLDEILHAFRIGLNEYFGGWQGQNCSLKIVEQSSGTPENTSENSKKPLRLSRNIAWENRIEEWR